MTIFYIWNWNCQSNDILRPRPCIHPVQPPAYSNAGVWVSAYCCRNLYWWILPSADSFLLIFLCFASFSFYQESAAPLNAAFCPVLTITSFRDLKAEERLSKTSANLVLKDFIIEPWSELFVYNTVRRTTLFWVRRSKASMWVQIFH